jgi:hypothetical protein
MQILERVKLGEAKLIFFRLRVLELLHLIAVVGARAWPIH